MRSIALFAAVCSVVVCEIQIGEPLNNACQKLCHVRNEAQATNFNLTRALKGCCDEASACVVPAHFYNVLCVKELMDVCNSAEKRLAANLSCIQQLCCGNLNSNETGRKFKGSRRCFRNISVSWNDERFWTVRDERPIFKWNRKHWEFFLNMSTQTCLNSTERTSLTPSSVTIKFKYPIFAKRENYEKRFVYAFYAPASYLVMKKGDHDMLTVLGESVEHLWVTLCICITWTLISGVIIWLLVSLVIRLFDKLSVHFLYSIGQTCFVSTTFIKQDEKGGWDIDSSVQFCCRILCSLENLEQFTREVCEFCHKVVLPAGKSQPKTCKIIIKFSLNFPFLGK